MQLESLTTTLEEIQAEVKTMKLSRHENIVDLFCCFVVGDNLWLVMPLMDKGSCYYALRMLRKAHKLAEGQGLQEEVIATIMRDLLNALDYIHKHGQIHRDIKAGNILLNSEGRVAVADFGVAGWMSQTGDRSGSGGRCMRTFVGTPCWMAPEVMEQTKGYNEKADIWSVGITALELFKGYAPYAKLPPMQVLIKTLNEPPPGFKSYVDAPGAPSTAPSKPFAAFIQRCLVKDPRMRPSAHDLLMDPFIKRFSLPKQSQLVDVLLVDVPEVGTVATKGDGAEAKPVTKFVIDPKVSYVHGTTWVFPDDPVEAGEEGATGEDTGEAESAEALAEMSETILQLGGEGAAAVGGAVAGTGAI